MEKAQFLSILTSYLAGKATPEEESFLYAYYKLFMADEDVLALLKDHEKEKLKLSIKADIDAYIDHPAISIKRLAPWSRIAVAASIILAVSAGGYFLLHKQPPQQQQLVQNPPHDLKPGGNKAILTLANGQQITLTGAKNGVLAQQGTAQVSKTANGQVVYTIAGNQVSNTAEAVQINTIQTPRGGKYTLTLADGTLAVLDAASSIRYPVAFTGKERRVEITGQVYFEVVHNATKPFRVTVKGQTIEDLGTHFNINAYDDEPVITTTLLEGSISIANSNTHKILKPGQEALIAQNSLKVRQADLEKAVAWKNDTFVFNGDNIEPIMRQVARWYDADIVYQTPTKDKDFVGSISRFKNVSEVLRKLELTGIIHFKVEGRRITVMP